MDAKFGSSFWKVEQLNSPLDSDGTREKNQIHCLLLQVFNLSSLYYCLDVLLIDSVRSCP